MIVGIGVDVVEVERVARAWARFGTRFAGKVLSSAELRALDAHGDPVSWLAKRFAAKEAVAKALGTGMRAGVHFSQIEISRDRGGAPTVKLSGAAMDRAERLGVQASHVSISDERACAVAFAVLER
ncbi:MAG: holo-ACP synthase [Gammaproteobacteria bacterium]|nr:holo-ACP synthase [Gammaproteobacteria bacterium]